MLQPLEEITYNYDLISKVNEVDNNQGRAILTPKAQHQLEKAYLYILLDSYQNANKVKEDISFYTQVVSKS